MCCCICWFVARISHPGIFLNFYGNRAGIVEKPPGTRVRTGCTESWADPTTFSYPTENMRRLYEVNVHGAFFTAREAARTMASRSGGSIILIASMSSHVSSLALPLLSTLASTMTTDSQHSTSGLFLPCHRSRLDGFSTATNTLQRIQSWFVERSD